MSPLFHQTSNEGAIIMTSVHDGWLDGILISSKNMELTIRSFDNRGIRLVVPNVIALKADNFRLGNIIFEVKIYQKRNCPAELFAAAFGDTKEEATKHNAARLAKVGDGWNLLAISSSYGCELAAISAVDIGLWNCEFTHGAESKGDTR